MSAILWLSLAFQISPEVLQHINAGLQAKSAGDLPAAIREFTKVVELAPDLSAAHMNLGAVYYDNKDYASAIPPLRKALALNADLPGAHDMLGAALLAQGFAAEAIPHLEVTQSNALLGVALLETGRAREAVDRLEAALEKHPGEPDLLYYLAQAHAELQKQLFEKLRMQNPNAPRTHQALGEALAASGKRSEAETHFRAALSERPDLRGVHHALGELYLAAGDFEKAEPEFRAEVKLTPGSAAAAYKLGVVLANRGRGAEAIIELIRANGLQPGMPETLLELGKALHASGDAKGAEEYLRQMLRIESDTTLAESAHFQLAQIYRKLGRPADADRQMKAFQALRGRRSQ